MTDKKLRTIARKDLPSWAKDAPSGMDFVLIPKEVTQAMISGEITREQYKAIEEKCEVVIVE